MTRDEAIQGTISNILDLHNSAELSNNRSALRTILGLLWDAATEGPGSVLNGTVSCEECGALMLSERRQDHSDHHRWVASQISQVRS